MFLEEGADSCSPKPNSKNITLPEGCVVKGTTGGSVVDVGECESAACVRNDSSFNSSCQDPSFCCGPSDTVNVLVDCNGIMSFNLTKVIYCSCGSCTKKVTIIQGIVVGGPQEEPMKYGDVIYDGKIVAYTDGKGRFSFEIPGKVHRIAVTFKDVLYEEFEERTKIFLINEGSSDFHKITLKQVPTPISFNASEPVDIPLRGDPNIESFADLELPEESFLTEDGSVFQGNAKAIISVYDSRNLSDILSAPGDFSTINEEGEDEILETFGMIKLKFEDDNGKKLVMSKPMKVYIDPEKLNISVQVASSLPMKLYWLDKKTHRWREIGDFQLEDGSKRRRKRYNRVFFVGTVTSAMEQETLNFDRPEERVAIRVTTNPPKAGVVVRVIRREGTVYRGYIEETTTNLGITCIPIWRDEQCSLQALSNGKYIMPIQDNVANLPSYIEARIEERIEEATGAIIRWIEFRSRLDENSNLYSPMYKHVTAEVDRCKSSQNLPEGSQFTFEEPKAAPTDFSIFDYSQTSWKRGGCYIKVKINGENAIFAAESYKGNNLEENGKLGLHLRMSRDVDGGVSKIVCLQISCPVKNQYTYVKIAPLTKTCRYKGLEDDVSEVQFPICPVKDLPIDTCAVKPPAVQGQEKWLWIPKGNGQSLYKTFHGIAGPRGLFGEARCLQGTMHFSKQEPDKITDGGFALEYDCR